MRSRPFVLRTLFCVTLLTGCCALLAPPVKAQFLITLNPDTQGGAPGSTITYSGTLFNQSTTNNIYLNGLTGTTSDSWFTVDQNSFFNFVPAFLAPNTSYTGNIFTVNIAPSASQGSVGTGTITIQGGTGTDDTFNIGTDNFTVVAGNVVPAPPAPLVFGAMMGIGSAVTAFTRRRRRATAASAADAADESVGTALATEA